MKTARRGLTHVKVDPEETRIRPDLSVFRLLRRVFEYTRPHARLRNWLSVQVAIRSALLPICTWVMGLVVSGPIQHQDERGILLGALGFGALALLTNVLFHFRYRFALELGEAVIHDLRAEVFAHILRMPMAYFEATKVGRIIGRVTSDIDSIRIAGSYSLIKVFIWAIPILGFVGTVLGLSAAIGNFSGVMGGAKDIDALMGSLGGVTTGLGTSFDTTLLGLIYSILLSFPMSALQKGEDDSLNTIDAYCNDTLLPRLNDDGGHAGSQSHPDVAKAMDRLVERVLKAQTQLVADLKDVAGLVSGQVTSLEERAKSQSDAMVKTFTGQTEAMVKAFTESMQTLQRTTGDTLADNVSNVTAHVAAIDRGLNSLNGILEAVGEKQVRVELKPRSVWQRLLGRS